MSTLSTPSMIHADNVSLSLGDRDVLRSLSFDLRDGEFLSVVGPSGCGKTSLLRLIAGLEVPTIGTLESNGRAAVCRAAYVFQEPNLLPWRTVVENVALPLEIQGLPAKEIQQAAIDAIRIAGLQESDFQKRPAQLSGGMRMRVSLARAIVVRPGIILFDEPFAALDDLLRGRLNEEILRLRDADGWTAVFVTHNVGEAVFLSDRVMVLEDLSSSEDAHSLDAMFEIDLPRPRDFAMRSSAKFAELSHAIAARLRRDAR